MSNPLKKLAGQTAIYGLSSIVGRFLNFLLTPLFAIYFAKDQFGIITEMYAYVAFLVVFLTYGMETAYFRFSTLEEQKDKPVYSTVLISLLSTTFIFITAAIVFAQSVADWLQYPKHTEYVIWFAIIVGLDAVSSIPLAKLRADNKAVRFAGVNFVNIGVNISLNLFFVVYCSSNYETNSNWLIETFYNPEIGVGYVFISNLIASICKFLMLVPGMNMRQGIQLSLWKIMFRYSSPMLIVGLAGIVNETIDRILIKKIVYAQQLEALGSQAANTFAQEQNGIYGANYKLAMIISMFIQACRYAAEPFFFKEEHKNDSKETYVKIMNYFTIVVALMFLVITLYLSLFKYFIPNPEFWEGLHIVPILLAAYVCLGIYYNQSVWYKLSQKTGYGAIISLGGAVLTITINWIFIPKYGYTAAAWATLSCYSFMMIISYFVGKRHYPIPYDIKKFFLYMGAAVAIYIVSIKADPIDMLTTLGYTINTALLGLFLALVYFMEKNKFKALRNG
ncbi:MAG: polysaccharide biosynthesis protein [Flavobacteriales bacterium]|nr:polysaccharide biosynthesis protein [Flavobacteriales bacterium]